MLKKEEKNSIIEICPVRNVVSRFGNKWALLVVLVLSEQKTVRFNELCRLIPDVSSRVLSGTLKTLEADGLVARKVYPVVPPQSGIQTDRHRTISRSVYRSAYRVGTDQHEVHCQAP